MSKDEAAIEAELQAKGLNAPRLTPDHIDATIVGEAFHVFPGTTLTVCVLTLRNGFTVTGESAAASPANFDEEVGRKIARDNARNKIWQLEGYLLRERLSGVEPAAASDLQPTRMPDGEIRQMAQRPQSPSIGPVVLFTPALQPSDAHKVNGAEEFVAIIGQVFADPGNPRPYCNLLVMPPFAPPYWEGSVQEDDASDLVQPPMRSWRWPPRA